MDRANENILFRRIFQCFGFLYILLITPMYCINDDFEEKISSSFLLRITNKHRLHEIKCNICLNYKYL